MSSVPSLGCIEDNVRGRDGLRSNRFAMASKDDTKICEFVLQSTIQRDGKARREQLTLFRKSPLTRKRQSGQSLHRRQACIVLSICSSDATKRTELPRVSVFEVGVFEA